MTIHLWEWSESGLPVVLLHGIGNTGRIWDPLARSQATGLRWIAVDLRGHGDSDRAEDRDYSISTHVADLSAVIECLGISPCALVGHSLGAAIAAHFAARLPERVRGVALVDPAMESNAEVSRLIRRQLRELPESFASVSDYVALLADRYPLATDAFLLHLARSELTPLPTGRFAPKYDPGYGRRKEREETEPMIDVLRRLRCPVQVIRGRASSVLSPLMARRLADEEIRESTLAVVPGAGHAVMADNPGETSSALLGFLQPLARAGRAEA